MRLWQREEDEGWPVVMMQQRVAVVRTAMADGRRQQAPRRLGRLLWQRLAIVAWRHGRKAVLEDKGRWWPGREGSSEEWQATANRWGAMGGSKDRRRRWRKAATAFRCGRGQRQRARRRGTKVAGGGRGGRGKKRQRAWLRSGRGGVWLRLWLRRRGQRRCATATVGGRGPQQSGEGCGSGRGRRLWRQREERPRKRAVTT
ncbi:hypothetical protein BHE74_00027365 [Ensete ventricosum]|nr:hypothetical protein BHE74_00027365 [Ensete ventricosum]